MNKPKLFDIHSHLNFPQFDKDREEVIKRMQENNIWTVCVGTDKKTSQEAMALAEKYENIYASVGLHPTDRDGDFSVEYYKNLARHPKVVAIGECGLDYYRIKNNELRIKQRKIFEKQIELAMEINKPLMIHCRDARPLTPERSDGGRAHEEVIEILSAYKEVRGNIHFFSGDWEQAQKYFDLGFTISFAGPVTFADQYDEIIKKAPLDKIMIETDSPFACPQRQQAVLRGGRAAPAPYRGQRNEPLYVQEIAQKIAKIRGISFDEVAEATTQNALRLFLNRDIV